MREFIRRRRSLERSIDWRAYREQRKHLVELFPAAIKPTGAKAKAPLAIDIKADILGANVGLDEAQIHNFLKAYTYGPKYLRAVKVGATRVDLTGMPCGEVNFSQADFARKMLAAHLLLMDERRNTREAA